MEIVVKVAAVGIVGTVFALVLKKTNGEFSMLLIIAVICAVTAVAAELILPAVNFIRDMAQSWNISGTVISPVIKTVGIAVLTEFTSKVCKDSGQSAVAAAVEFTGSCAAVYVALPVVELVLKMLSELM